MRRSDMILSFLEDFRDCWKFLGQIRLQNACGTLLQVIRQISQVEVPTVHTSRNAMVSSAVWRKWHID